MKRAINLYFNPLFFFSIGFLFYLLIFFIGSIYEIKILNYIGFIIFFYILVFSKIKELLILKKDRTIFLGFLIVLYTVLNFFLVGIKFKHYDFYFKQVMFFIIYITIASYSNQTLVESPKFNKYFITMILMLISLSFVYGKKFEYGGEERLSGFFTNPNNFALIALSLLFFIDSERDNITKIIFIHLIILISLIFSATSGAVVAYLFGLILMLRQKIFKMIPLLIIIGIILVILNIHFNIIFMEKITKQFYMLMDVVNGDLDITSLNFGELVIQYSSVGLSFLWRLHHWYNLLTMYSNSSILNKIFGFGLGSSKDLMYNMPHNEYVGFIFEQGLIGFMLILIFFLMLFFRIKEEKKYIFIIFAVYAFSENIITNMIFMSLFALFLANSQKNSYENKNFRK